MYATFIELPVEAKNENKDERIKSLANTTPS